MDTTAQRQGAASAPLSENAPSFDELGLGPDALAAVDDLGYERPTPVQARAIPEALSGRDVLAAAQTGTGKTAAFLLPTLNNLSTFERGSGCGPSMLVVTPTRELAQQIESVCRTIAKRTGHMTVTVVGGVSYNPQRNALKRGCDVLIATPGRLIDLVNQGACSLDQVKVLVLDEADRMLDMGFLPDIKRIVAAVPDERQTLLFSATLDEKQVGSITSLVDDPARIEVAPATSTADSVDQYVLPVSLDQKNSLLADVLEKEGPQRVIVFLRTKHRADACKRRLTRAGISCGVIHGDRSQNQRERALRQFRSGECDVLVATDVLARGIDITDVRYVVNFDVPRDPVDYIHRIGRTGRGGEVGWSLTFVTEQDVAELFDIEALMGKTIELYDAEGLDVGSDPVHLDPDRVAADRVSSKKAKKKRRRKGKAQSANAEAAAVATPETSRPAKRRKAKKPVTVAVDPMPDPAPRASAEPKRAKKKAKAKKKTSAAPEAPRAIRPGMRSSGVRNASVGKQGSSRKGSGKKPSGGRRGGGVQQRSGKPARRGARR